MAYKSGNPALNSKTFSSVPAAVGISEAMTLDGVATKSFLLIGLVFASGFFGWTQTANDNEASFGFALIALLIAFVIAVILAFKKSWAPVLAPVYALLEGYALGAISQAFNTEYDGIVVQAVLLTGGIFLSMLMLYRLHIIRATENFKLGIAAATGGIAIYYLVNLGFSFFGTQLPLINSNSPWGIAFTVAVIVIAAFNLVVDFDFIEEGVAKKAPKYMEWYASFGLLVTLIWLYIELLRLLAKIRSR